MIICPEAFPPFEGAWGVFRILMRTDGQWIVYDPRRPLARKTVRVFKKAGDAVEAAAHWTRLGHG